MPKKLSQWKASLIDLLQEANPQSRMATLRWLGVHMDDYLERFAGFVKLGTIPIAKLVEGDLFIIIQAAVEVFDECLQKPTMDETIQTQWSEFKNSVLWMERVRDPADVALMLETYSRFKKSLEALHN
jgi:hypothetical protein